MTRLIKYEIDEKYKRVYSTFDNKYMVVSYAEGKSLESIIEEAKLRFVNHFRNIVKDNHVGASPILKNSTDFKRWSLKYPHGCVEFRIWSHMGKWRMKKVKYKMFSSYEVATQKSGWVTIGKILTYGSLEGALRGVDFNA